MDKDTIETTYVLGWVNSHDNLEFDRHYPDGSPIEFPDEEAAIAAIPPGSTRIVLKTVTRRSPPD